MEDMTMATRLSLMVEQLERGGAILTSSAYMTDLEKFRALALMSGAAIKSEWVDAYGKREIRESFEVRDGDHWVVVTTHRAPTVRDWNALAAERDARDPKVVTR